MHSGTDLCTSTMWNVSQASTPANPSPPPTSSASLASSPPCAGSNRSTNPASRNWNQLGLNTNYPRKSINCGEFFIILYKPIHFVSCMSPIFALTEFKADLTEEDFNEGIYITLTTLYPEILVCS